MSPLTVTILLAGSVLVALLGWYSIHLKGKVDGEIARAVSEGKLHPGDVATFRMACRAGVPLYRWPDGRFRLVPPPDAETPSEAV